MYNHLWAVSASRGTIKPGAFYEPVGKLSKIDTASSKDPELGPNLWDWTDKELQKWMK